MRELLIQATHNRLAHYGTSKTYQDLAKDTFWPGQWQQTKKFVEQCDNCQRNKQPTQKPPGIAQMIQVPERPWQSIGMDVLGPLPLSSGYTHALVVVDRFSSSVRIAPLTTNFTARDVCDALLKKVYCYYGMPMEIISDRGSQFVSNFSTALHEAFDVQLLPSTAFHQQTNGSAERTIKTVTQMLRSYVNNKQTDWVDQLWRTEYAINNAPTEAYKTTPIEICQGQIVKTIENYSPTQSDAVNDHLEKLNLGFQIFHDALTTYRYRQADYSQKKRNPDLSFKVGDLVMYERRTWTKDLSHKLHSVWRGPYRILAIDQFDNCTLDIPKRFNRHPVFAHDKLKLYHDNPEHKRDPIPAEPEQEQYVIDRIVDHRMKKSGSKEYKVQWKGYDEDEDTWEPAEVIEQDAPGAVQDYRKVLEGIETQFTKMEMD